MSVRPRLTLYHYPSCPFCQRVFRALDELGLPIERRDIHQDSAALNELVAARGRQTVPVLRIQHADGRVEWMPESLDIIAYLRRSGAA